MNSFPLATQAQPGRKGDPDIQVPFHFHPGRRRRQIPTIAVVPPPRASRTHLEPSAPVSNYTKRICICSRPQEPQLHEETIRPDRLRDSNSRKTRQPFVMGHKIGARIQPGHINGTPSLLPSLCNQNESNQEKRHCFFQAPVHHQPNTLT